MDGVPVPAVRRTVPRTRPVETAAASAIGASSSADNKSASGSASANRTGRNARAGGRPGVAVRCCPPAVALTSFHQSRRVYSWPHRVAHRCVAAREGACTTRPAVSLDVRQRAPSSPPRDLDIGSAEGKVEQSDVGRLCLATAHAFSQPRASRRDRRAPPSTRESTRPLRVSSRFKVQSAKFEVQSWTLKL